MVLLRIAAFLSLACLSGCWVTFSLRFRSLSWWTKLLVGVALSPLVLDLELYAARLAGISFEHASAGLAVVNLFALVPMLVTARSLARPSLASAAGACVFLVITFFALAPAFTSRSTVVYSTHAWMHAAPDYLVANGQLSLEESALAGVRLAYPWGGYIFQAPLSYVLNSTPAYSYCWTNAVWIALLYGLGVALAAEMGLSSVGAVFAPMWLFFGVNLAGAVLGRISAHGLHLPSFLFGDFRYSEWVWYFISPSQMVFAVAMVLALLLLLARNSLPVADTKHLTLVGLLLIGIGVVYPVLFPAALAIPGARIAADLIASGKKRSALRNSILLAGVSVASSLLTVANLSFITRARTAPAVTLSSMSHPYHLFHWSTPAGKSVELLVALGPLVLAAAVTFRKLWAIRPVATLVFLMGGLASAMLYTGLSMTGPFQNEYKFVFTAAACLFVFAAVWMEPLWRRTGTKAVAAGTALTAILAAPLIVTMYRYAPFWTTPGPEVRAAGFDLRLAASERLADVVDTIRTRTPADTILAADDMGIYLPALTQRSLFVGVSNKEADPGVAIPNDKLLRIIKGYDPELIDRRQSVQSALFHAENRDQAGQLLREMLALKRPVAVVVDTRIHPGLPAILGECGKGRRFFAGQGLEAWLFQP